MCTERRCTVTKSRYKSLMAFWVAHPSLCRLLSILDKLIVWLTVILYPAGAVYLFFTDRVMLIPFLVVPGSSFIMVSIFRKLYGAPRPYEVYGMAPAIKKESLKNSFPSRHVFSVFIIGMAFMQIDLRLGCLLFVMGAALAALRVLGGVHFIKDVAAGAAVGVTCGYIGFCLFFA